MMPEQPFCTLALGSTNVRSGTEDKCINLGDWMDLGPRGWKMALDESTKNLN